MRLVYLITIRAVSALLLTDTLRLLAARWVVLWNKPVARRHLRHYLTGRGAEVRVDTAALLDDDRGVRETLLHTIAHELRRGRGAGRCPVSQLSYADADWCFALGGLTLDWRARPDGSVAVRFIDRYHWSPADKRISRPLHRAAERMKRRGAAEFDIVGRETRVDRAELAKARLSSGGRAYRRFYM